MRVLRHHHHQDYCACVQHANAPTKAQHSSVTTVAHVQQFLNEWKIQCLVLVSLSLQVFLLFSAGFRKRHISHVLSMLLWLAYLSADSIAVYVLGHLTLHTSEGDPRNQLVLFWAPFLLLHLGGQDTITAFSMEDCSLWKRHLLNLTTQLAMAIYVVGEQLRWDKKLVAPIVLMFISGTTKYAERIWALRIAGSWEPRIRTSGLDIHTMNTELASMFSSAGEDVDPGRIVEVAMGIGAFQESIGFLMDVTPKRYTRGAYYSQAKAIIEKVARGFTSSGNGADWAYKLSEIRLSLIYDHLYTKFGSLKLKGLFLEAASYSGVDVWITYVLLVGAMVLEISSVLMWLVSSYWAYMTAFLHLQGRRRSKASRCAGRILLSTVKRLRPHPEKRLEWSGKVQQYSLMDDCIQAMAQRPVNWLLPQMMKQGYTSKHVVVSPEVKKVLLHKLCEIATSPDSIDKLAFSGSFRGEWAASWAASGARTQTAGSSAAQQALAASNIQDMDLVSSALLWHLVTEICFIMSEYDGDKNGKPPNCMFRTCSQQLSNYVMYLVAQCKVMLDSDGHNTLQECRTAHRWELIAMVWVEMVCYIQLSSGGEFLTHVHLLVFLLRTH
ncbi:hypothetical protein VPH35_000428 [Triticum aestivum]